MHPSILKRDEYLMLWAAAERDVPTDVAREFFTKEADAAGESLSDFLESHLEGSTACGAQVLYVSTGLNMDDLDICLPCLIRSIPPSAIPSLLANPAHITSDDFDAIALASDDLADTDMANNTTTAHGVTYRVCGNCGSAGQE